MPALPAPLVELHLHLEGCLSPQRAREFALRNPSLGDPPRGALEEDRWRFDELAGFLQLFGWGVRLLDGPGPYLEVLDDAAEFLEGQGVIYAELQVAIGVMHYFGIDAHEVLPALAARAEEHEARGGVIMNFIADGVRQFGVEMADRVLEDGLALRRHRIVGFGLGGDERAVPALEFGEVYARAREEGLGTCLHAGEGTTAEAVAEALDLGVDRVGHGISAAADPALMERLRTTATVLELCPGSNLRSGAWKPADGPHPIHRLHEHGVRIVLGSDDPAFFETSLREEYERCAREGIPPDTLTAFNADAVEAAFLPEEAKEALRRRLC